MEIKKNAPLKNKNMSRYSANILNYDRRNTLDYDTIEILLFYCILYCSIGYHLLSYYSFTDFITLSVLSYYSLLPLKAA